MNDKIQRSSLTPVPINSAQSEEASRTGELEGSSASPRSSSPHRIDRRKEQHDTKSRDCDPTDGPWRTMQTGSELAMSGNLRGVRGGTLVFSRSSFRPLLSTKERSPAMSLSNEHRTAHGTDASQLIDPASEKNQAGPSTENVISGRQQTISDERIRDEESEEEVVSAQSPKCKSRCSDTEADVLVHDDESGWPTPPLTPSSHHPHIFASPPSSPDGDGRTLRPPTNTEPTPTGPSPKPSLPRSFSVPIQRSLLHQYLEPPLGTFTQARQENASRARDTECVQGISELDVFGAGLVLATTDWTQSQPWVRSVYAPMRSTETEDAEMDKGAGADVDVDTRTGTKGDALILPKTDKG